MSGEAVKVESLVAELRNVLLPMGLIVDRVKVSGEGIFLQKTPFKIEVRKPGVVEAELRQEAMAEFLEAQSPGGLSNFSIEARDNRLYVSATKRMIVELKIQAIATLRIEGGKRLHVDLVSVDVMGAGATNLVQSQLDRINPVLDAAELPFNAILESVETRDGRVYIRGTLEP